MTTTLQIDWKIAGLLPQRLGDSLYFNKHPDPDYGRRVFGKDCDQILSTASLTTTKQFHQRFSSELRKEKGFQRTFSRFPYLLPFEEMATEVAVSMRLRIFSDRVLVITMSAGFEIETLDLSSAINLQKITDHPTLISLARFTFNVHFVSPPSQTSIRFQEIVPLTTISGAQLDRISMARLVTRHETIEGAAVAALFDKNETINFNSDVMLLDKQGLLFSVNSTDVQGQRNRISRMSQLFEFAIYILVLERASKSTEAEEKSHSTHELQKLSPILAQEVLRESVSASRGWDLIKRELRIKAYDDAASADKVHIQARRRVNWSRLSLIVAVIGLAMALWFQLYS